MRLFQSAGGNRLFPAPRAHQAHLCSFRWFFSWHLVGSSQACCDQYWAEYLKETLCVSPQFFLWAAFLCLLFFFFLIIFKVFIYLFKFWLHEVFVAAHGLCVVAHGLSFAVPHGLSCSSACGILVPQPGIEFTCSALDGKFLTTGPPGKSLFTILLLEF